MVEDWLTLQQGNNLLFQSFQSKIHRCFCVLKALDPIFCWAPLGEGSQLRLRADSMMSDDELWRGSVVL